MEPFKQRDWLYQHYVQKRLNLTQIQKILMEKHGVHVTPQTLYNWCKKFDLLKYRGRGRNLKPQTGMKKPSSPMQQRAAEMKRQQRNIAKKRMGK